MNETVTMILLWLLGVELPPAGEGVQWQLAGAWRWSRPLATLFCLGAAGSAAYVLWIYFRERSSAGRGMRLLLTGVRLSLILLVALVMLFELRLHFSRTSLPNLAMLIDETASMGIVDESDDQAMAERLQRQVASAGLSSSSRLNIAKSFLLADDQQFLKRLSRRYTLRTYSIAAEQQRMSSGLEAYAEELHRLQPTGGSSQHGVGVRGVLDDLRGAQPAALVYLTDGITTQGPSLSEVARYARRKAVPLYLVGIGSEKKVRGLDLADLVVDDIVFVDDYVDFEFNMTSYGLDGAVVKLVLKDKQTGEVLAEQEVAAGEDGVAQRERLSHRPAETGSVEYVIEVANLQEELKERRPQLSRRVEVRDDPIRVLMVQSSPSYEYRYLKNLLERDKTIELNVVLQDADLEYADQDRFARRVFPVDREDLFRYDVLILGNVDLGSFSRSTMETIAGFVTEKGGGLIFISGDQFNSADIRRSPLAQLIPVDLEETTVPRSDADLTEGFTVRPTLLGLSSPHMQLGDSRADTQSIWRNLPQLYWMVEAGRVRSGARILAEHPTRTGSDGQKMPLIVLHYVPPGKILWHAMDETHRWRLRVGDVVFARYWIQAIRYLSRAKLLGQRGVELSSDRNKYQSGVPVHVRVRFFDEKLAPSADDGVTMVLEGTDPAKRQVVLRRSPESPSVFTATVSSLPLGKFRGWLAAPNLTNPPHPVTFQVVTPPGEMARREMDAAEMKKAAQVSRGKFFDATTFDELIDQLPAGRPVKVASLPPIPLWNNWRVLLLYLFLLTGEWLLRRRAGML